MEDRMLEQHVLLGLTRLSRLSPAACGLLSPRKVPGGEPDIVASALEMAEKRVCAMRTPVFRKRKSIGIHGDDSAASVSSADMQRSPQEGPHPSAESSAGKTKRKTFATFESLLLQHSSRTTSLEERDCASWLLLSEEESGARAAATHGRNVSHLLHDAVAASEGIAAAFHASHVVRPATFAPVAAATHSAVVFCLDHRQLVLKASVSSWSCQEPPLLESSDTEPPPQQRMDDEESSIVCVYVAALPCALHDLYRETLEEEQQMRTPPNDDRKGRNNGETRASIFSSLVDFLLLSLDGGNAGSCAQQATVVMLLEPIMSERGAIGRAVKRLQYHFRTKDEIVEVSQRSAAGVDRPSQTKAEAVDDVDDNHTSGAVAHPVDSDEAPLPSTSLLSTVRPEHFLSYAQALSDDVACSIDGFLRAGLGSLCSQLVAETCADASLNHITLRASTVSGFMYWRSVLDRFSDCFMWPQLVKASTSGNSSGLHSHSRREFLHMSNCLFDLCKWTARRGTASAAALSFSAVVRPLVLHKLILASGGVALKTWCHLQVANLLEVCSQEAASPTLWRREFLLSARRKDGWGNECVSSEVAHHSISTVVVKFFRGLVAVVQTVVGSILLDDTTFPTCRTARKYIWKELVCHGIMSFGATYDLADPRQQNLVQTCISEHCDRLWEALMMAKLDSAIPLSGGARSTIWTPSELLAAIYSS